MPSRKRLTKKQLKRDRFVDTTFDWAVWARENARTAAVIAGGIVLVLLAVFLYRTSEARENRDAGQKFQEVVQAYGAGNYQLAANDFKQFLNQYGGTGYAEQARLYLGNSYLLAGDYASAIRTLEEFQQEHVGSSLAYAGATLLGKAYESAGKLDRAATAYATAREKARYDYERVAALMNEARVHASQKATAKAAAAYEQVLTKYPDDPAAADARVRRAELTAKPLGGNSTVAVKAPPTAPDSANQDRVLVAPPVTGATQPSSNRAPQSAPKTDAANQ